jgi:hypothetical protein
MKLKIQLTLILVLVVLMYYNPLFLTDITRSPLGKLALVGGVLGLSYKFGRNTGIISALIVLLLLHNCYEGLENKNDAKQTEKISGDADDKTPDSSADDEEDEDEDATQEKEAADKTTNTIVANEEVMRPKASNETLASDGAGPSSEPLAMPATTTEGFALLN